MIEPLVQIIGFTDDAVIIHFVARIVLGNVLAVSGCVIHTHFDTVDTACQRMLRDPDRVT